MSLHEIVDLVDKGFKRQGGTGFSGRNEYRGCRCAISVLIPEGVEPGIGVASVVEQLPPGFLSVTCAFTLSICHDRALMEAIRRELPGLDGLGELRALYGTKAYDHVMSELRLWASTSGAFME